MNTLMEISIATPIHNEQGNRELVYYDLIAVLESRGSDCEIISVDDGSDDKSVKIIDSLAECDGRVRHRYRTGRVCSKQLHRTQRARCATVVGL